ncbi:DUF2306 domain-containing protein [Paenibacillus alvei]|uniref:DUF2306 domain-containing protein n=1 Tax=Paenibacillus alvei TaxID=44250 RepID=A0AAP7A1X6_PAEAL|nr:DUF2306 domain-containing protein [Paenibacillus alvei]
MSVDRKPRMGWKVIVVLTLGASAFAIAPYVLLDPEQSRVSLDAAFPLHYPLLLIHIFSSFIALLIGWLQFLPSLRTTRSRVHRLIGRFYLGLVAIGGITGIIVGMYTESYIRQLAFLTLVVLWIFTGWKGYQTARHKRFDSHRIWMIRNYAVTLVPHGSLLPYASLFTSQDIVMCHSKVSSPF